MAINLKDKTILITSNENWDGIWYSKHNYAWELAKNNHVYFINSPTSWKFSNLFSNLFSNKISIKNINPSLQVISFSNFFPNTIWILKEINNLINSIRIRKIVAKKYKSYILFSFTPLILFRPKFIKCKLSLFLVMDMYWTTFYGGNILAKSSDGLILVSEHILKEYERINKPKLVLSHAISDDEFIYDDKKLNEIKNSLHGIENYGLFVGSIDERLNFNLIEKMAKRWPKQTFIFIGPLNISKDHPHVHLFDNSIENIVWLGSKPYKDLKYYIKLSAFCISPMDINYPGNHISHHKTLPYLAQGKAIFSPLFQEYFDIKELMYMCDDDSSLIKLLEKFLVTGDSLDIVEKRIQFARAHSYQNILKRIEVFINEK
jgi:hypothetical protein